MIIVSSQSLQREQSLVRPRVAGVGLGLKKGIVDLMIHRLVR